MSAIFTILIVVILIVSFSIAGKTMSEGSQGVIDFSPIVALFQLGIGAFLIAVILAIWGWNR